MRHLLMQMGEDTENHTASFTDKLEAHADAQAFWTSILL